MLGGPGISADKLANCCPLSHLFNFPAPLNAWKDLVHSEFFNFTVMGQKENVLLIPLYLWLVCG